MSLGMPNLTTSLKDVLCVSRQNLRNKISPGPKTTNVLSVFENDMWKITDVNNDFVCLSEYPSIHPTAWLATRPPSD